MAQHANPNVKGQKDPCRAHETKLVAGLTKKSTRIHVFTQDLLGGFGGFGGFCLSIKFVMFYFINF